MHRASRRRGLATAKPLPRTPSPALLDLAQATIPQPTFAEYYASTCRHLDAIISTCSLIAAGCSCLRAAGHLTLAGPLSSSCSFLEGPALLSAAAFVIFMAANAGVVLSGSGAPAWYCSTGRTLLILTRRLALLLSALLYWPTQPQASYSVLPWQRNTVLIWHVWLTLLCPVPFRLYVQCLVADLLVGAHALAYAVHRRWLPALAVPAAATGTAVAGLAPCLAVWALDRLLYQRYQQVLAEAAARADALDPEQQHGSEASGACVQGSNGGGGGIWLLRASAGGAGADAPAAAWPADVARAPVAGLAPGGYAAAAAPSGAPRPIAPAAPGHGSSTPPGGPPRSPSLAPLAVLPAPGAAPAAAAPSGASPGGGSAAAGSSAPAMAQGGEGSPREEAVHLKARRRVPYQASTVTTALTAKIHHHAAYLQRDVVVSSLVSFLGCPPPLPAPHAPHPLPPATTTVTDTATTTTTTSSSAARLQLLATPAAPLAVPVAGPVAPAPLPPLTLISTTAIEGCLQVVITASFITAYPPSRPPPTHPPPASSSNTWCPAPQSPTHPPADALAWDSWATLSNPPADIVAADPLGPLGIPPAVNTREARHVTATTPEGTQPADPATHTTTTAAQLSLMQQLHAQLPRDLQGARVTFVTGGTSWTFPAGSSSPEIACLPLLAPSAASDANLPGQPGQLLGSCQQQVSWWPVCLVAGAEEGAVLEVGLVEEACEQGAGLDAGQVVVAGRVEAKSFVVQAPAARGPGAMTRLPLPPNLDTATIHIHVLSTDPPTEGALLATATTVALPLAVASDLRLAACTPNHPTAVPTPAAPPPLTTRARTTTSTLAPRGPPPSSLAPASPTRHGATALLHDLAACLDLLQSSDAPSPSVLTLATTLLQYLADAGLPNAVAFLSARCAAAGCCITMPPAPPPSAPPPSAPSPPPPFHSLRPSPLPSAPPPRASSTPQLPLRDSLQPTPTPEPSPHPKDRTLLSTRTPIKSASQALLPEPHEPTSASHAHFRQPRNPTPVPLAPLHASPLQAPPPQTSDPTPAPIQLTSHHRPSLHATINVLWQLPTTDAIATVLLSTICLALATTGLSALPERNQDAVSSSLLLGAAYMLVLVSPHALLATAAARLCRYRGLAFAFQRSTLYTF